MAGKSEQWLTDEGLLLIMGWAKDGLIDKQIAKNMGVAYSTFRVWVKKYPALSAAIKKSKAVADREVENALFNKATGQRFIEKQAVKLKTVHYDNGKRVKEEERIEIIDVERLLPPDTTAQIFWLKNRKPDHWRDKQNIEHSGGTTLEVSYEDELKSIIQKGKDVMKE
jgi:hypothetical protein